MQYYWKRQSIIIRKKSTKDRLKQRGLESAMNQKENQALLDQAIADIKKNYGRYELLRAVEDRRLPNRNLIKEIIKELRCVKFAGYMEQEDCLQSDLDD